MVESLFRTLSTLNTGQRSKLAYAIFERDRLKVNYFCVNLPLTTLMVTKIDAM